MAASDKLQNPIAASTLAALGIVFGDIGTSPLYAFRECFGVNHGAAPNPQNLVGAASLIVWSLVLIVSIKYLFLILRLDNKGEGGILALAALVRNRLGERGKKSATWILFLGLAGAALIYADGALTPAISVLSAVEGIAVNSPALSEWVVPMTVAILAGLFAIQRFGTGNVGRLFGPIVLLWFAALAGLGIWQLCRHPQVLLSLSPWEGVMFLQREWSHALPILGATFLAVTGGEALYADLGHFGRLPIRVGWFAVVFPALVLNYLGQAALVALEPEAIRSPFFLMAGPSLGLPLTILAALAAIIASQALISGAFSLTVQAIQLGCLPRCTVRHTSHQERGQVYVPFVNWMLALGCILLVVTLKTSSALAGAYGIAIALTMVITSILLIPAARTVIGWTVGTTAIIASFFLFIDLSYLVANCTKLLHMGWLPLVAAIILISLMLIWIWGRNRLAKRFAERDLETGFLIKELSKKKIHRAAGVAVYLSGSSKRVPPALLHNLKHNKVIHETTLLLHVITLDQPKLEESERLECYPLGEGMWDVSLKFGFAETPNVPKSLKASLPCEIRFHEGKASYFLGRESYCIGKNSTPFDRFRLFVFALMARNASPANAYFQLPPGRVVELGSQLTL